jgi:hypothetical protein
MTKPLIVLGSPSGRLREGDAAPSFRDGLHQIFHGIGFYGDERRPELLNVQSLAHFRIRYRVP